MVRGDLTHRCDRTPTVELRYEGRTPSEAVIDALAAVQGKEAAELPPLYEAVDPEALDRLFDRDEDARPTVLGFTVGDWELFVRGDGTVLVYEPTETPDGNPTLEEQDA